MGCNAYYVQHIIIHEYIQQCMILVHCNQLCLFSFYLIAKVYDTTAVTVVMVAITRHFCFNAIIIILLHPVFIKRVSYAAYSKPSQHVVHYQCGHPSVWIICAIMPLVPQMLFYHNFTSVVKYLLLLG